MFNIPENVEIKNLEKTGCKKSHIVHQLGVAGAINNVKYDYFGKIVTKGTLDLMTCNGAFKIRFDTKSGWARNVEVL